MTPSPEKSLVQEAEALRRIVEHHSIGACPDCCMRAAELQTWIAEQQRLAAENRSLREVEQILARIGRDYDEPLAERVRWLVSDFEKHDDLLRLFIGKFRTERQRRAQVEQALRMDKPWPLPDVLRKLADAADHLLKDHDCDQHGWEGVVQARDAARAALKELEDSHV